MTNLSLIQESLTREGRAVTVEQQLANGYRLNRGRGVDGTSTRLHVQSSQLDSHRRGNR